MVLEDLLSPDKAESMPRWMLIFGAAYTSVAMLLSFWVFKDQSSLFMIFLLTLGIVPIVYKILKMEEEKDLTDLEEKVLLKEHSKALSAFMYLFIGATIAFAFWYVVLPSSTVSTLYQTQTSTIASINGRVTGLTTEVDGNVVGSFEIFKRIFFNNIKVLMFCILFSFIYGAGAIFILMWNASVIGTAIGNFVRTSITELMNVVGGSSFGQYFSIISLGLFKYAIHGIPEILAYFVAALAGGIISIAIVNYDHSSRKFEHIILDSADLLLVAIFIIFVAAVLEVYVTPIVFPMS